MSGRVRAVLRPRLTFRNGLWACRADTVRRGKLYMHPDPRVAYWLWFIARSDLSRVYILHDLGLRFSDLGRALSRPPMR